MLRFFQKIRTNHVTKGNSKKYLLYALGEIFLIMVGILLALQVNDWNEERKDRLLEAELKAQLFIEFSRDLEQLEDKIVMRNTLIESSSKILEYMDHPESADPDSIAFYLSTTGYRPTFDSTSTVFIARSDLSLIQNQQLKAYLTEWEINVGQLTEEEIAWRDFRFEKRDDALNVAGVNRDLAVIFDQNKGSDLFLLDGQEDRLLPFDRANREIDYFKLLESPELENYLVFCITSNMDANQNSESLRERILKILELLQE